MKQEKYYLSGKQALDLRGLGHHLKPTAMVGREGLTPAVREALEAVLAAHELVKVKIQEGCPLERAEAAEQLAAGSGARIVQIIGRMILFYRPKPPEKRAPASRSEAAGCATRGCKRAAGTPRPAGGRGDK
ncbi:MAG: YhbY family RNA-binding protein, partial [Desulfurivibrio sp.]